MKQILLFAALALALASQMADAATLPINPQQPTSPAAKKFVVHEWGTFTSVIGSNGERLGGLHHEEETLPSFIAGRDVLKEISYIPGSGGTGNCRPSKGMPVCDDYVAPSTYQVRPENVTQKMETPVIYFYSDEKVQSKVNVGFPQGVISQYFPAPISFSPAIGNLRGLSNGRVTFDVEVTTEKLPLPQVESGNVYGPAREVASNDVRSGDQNERFIFYRGLGDFVTALHATSGVGQGLALQNVGAKISQVILLDVTSTTGAVKTLGSMDYQQMTHVNNKDLANFRSQKVPRAEFEAQAQKVIVDALVASGLYPDESLAMFNTWKTSYLRSHGLRVLYVLSRQETDRLLPINITPQPTELVRTLVGRIEILHAEEEQQMLANLRAGKELVIKEDRFAEPKLRRLLRLTNVVLEQGEIKRQINLLNK